MSCRVLVVLHTELHTELYTELRLVQDCMDLMVLDWRTQGA